jgi:hypothetical protein
MKTGPAKPSGQTFRGTKNLRAAAAARGGKRLVEVDRVAELDAEIHQILIYVIGVAAAGASVS